jgi:hypothetical protein
MRGREEDGYTGGRGGRVEGGERERKEGWREEASEGREGGRKGGEGGKERGKLAFEPPREDGLDLTAREARLLLNDP